VADLIRYFTLTGPDEVFLRTYPRAALSVVQARLHVLDLSDPPAVGGQREASGAVSPVGQVPVACDGGVAAIDRDAGRPLPVAQ
jgi:hypothetical protein